MKYLKNTLIILVGTLFIYSCSNEDFVEPVQSEPQYGNISSGSIQATLNGDLFSCDNTLTMKHNSSLIQITASDITHGLTIALSSESKGLYSIGGEEANYLSYTSVVYDETGSVETKYTSQQKYNATGTIEVLETDIENNTISGIFNGTIVLDKDANISLDIKDGLFNQVPL